MAALGRHRRRCLFRDFHGRTDQQCRQRRFAGSHLFTMATEFNLPANQLVLPLALATSCSFMLPVGTPPNAIVFGTGLVPQRAMMRVGFYLNIIFVILITALSLILF